LKRKKALNFEEFSVSLHVLTLGDLENVLKQQRAKETPLPENILKKWIGQMVEALAFVHSKLVIHRDLKPSNIFMTAALDISIGLW
jgi:serine/threonine protein kinase